jgi:hypothetical protein
MFLQVVFTAILQAGCTDAHTRRATLALLIERRRKTGRGQLTMKIRSYEIAVLCAGAYLLFGTLRFGQAQQAQNKNNKTIQPRDAQSGMASGRLQSAPSGHATAPQGDAKSAAQSNPMYKDSGNAGSNPLYQGKNKTAAKSGSGHETVEYKDPEDMTTRYRPGNNKTTRAAKSDEKKSGSAPKQ